MMPTMDPHDVDCIEERARFVEEVHEWAKGKIDPEIINAAIDAVPEDCTNGFVVVWMPYREGDYVAKLCTSRLGVGWYTWKARRQRSLFSFVLDIYLAADNAWTYRPAQP